jgi:hypothetical protein
MNGVELNSTSQYRNPNLFFLIGNWIAGFSAKPRLGKNRNPEIENFK